MEQDDTAWALRSAARVPETVVGPAERALALLATGRCDEARGVLDQLAFGLAGPGARLAADRRLIGFALDAQEALGQGRWLDAWSSLDLLRSDLVTEQAA